MTLNKEGNIFTFTFATIMVLIVAVSLEESHLTLIELIKFAKTGTTIIDISSIKSLVFFAKKVVGRIQQINLWTKKIQEEL